MNAQDKKEVDAILTILHDAADRLGNLADAEQEKYDNMNEGLQASERGQAMEQAAQELELARDEVESAIGTLEGME